jgi:hypothetical protein
MWPVAGFVIKNGPVELLGSATRDLHVLTYRKASPRPAMGGTLSRMAGPKTEWQGQGKI